MEEEEKEDGILHKELIDLSTTMDYSFGKATECMKRNKQMVVEERHPKRVCGNLCLKWLLLQTQMVAFL